MAKALFKAFLGVFLFFGIYSIEFTATFGLKEGMSMSKIFLSSVTGH